MVGEPTDIGKTRIDSRSLVALRGPARRLSLRPRAHVSAARDGNHLTPFRGRGMEFNEARIYQAGDEIRHMDWRVTARTGQPHVKLFHEERERPVWLWVDQGASMRVGTRGAFKSVRAAEAAALLAWAAVDGGDRIAAVMFGGDCHRELPPRSRATGALRLIEMLAHTCTQPPGERGALHQQLDRLARLVKPGSLVFLLSDFRGLSHREEVLMGRLAAHNEIVIGLIHDPLEAELPPPGLYPVSNGRRTGWLDSRSRDRVEQHRQRFVEHWQRLRHVATRHAMRSFLLSTEQPAIEQLAAVL